MIRLFLVFVLVGQINVAAAAETEPRKVCADLRGILQTAVDRFIKGDYSHRVRIALEAHRRLECPVEELLDVLNVKYSKAKNGTK